MLPLVCQKVIIDRLCVPHDFSFLLCGWLEMFSTIDPPSILPSEVEASIKRLKRNKAPGEDNITGGVLQDGGDAMIQVLTDLFNTCLHHQQVSKAWKKLWFVLIYKKGNTSDIRNCRPISLLSIMYKVFSNILLRMIHTLDFHQSCEQADLGHYRPLTGNKPTAREG